MNLASSYGLLFTSIAVGAWSVLLSLNGGECLGQTVTSYVVYSNNYTVGDQERFRVAAWEVSVDQSISEVSGSESVTTHLDLPKGDVFLAHQFKLPFPEGEVIHFEMEAYDGAFVFYGNQLWVMSYSVSVQGGNPFDGSGTKYVEQIREDAASSLKDLIVGFRLGVGLDSHVGWARYQRSEAPILTKIYPWRLVDVMINPFPGQSIKAGVAPELPNLTATVVEGNPGRQLRLSWPDGFPGIHLERAPAFKTGLGVANVIRWQPVETTTQPVFLPLPDTGTGYFRLALDAVGEP